jgi:hypothetical protein
MPTTTLPSDATVFGELSLSRMVFATLAAIASAYTMSTILDFGNCSLRSSSKKLRKYNDDASISIERPPHVASMIPYVGSAIEMGQGITQFIRKYATKLQSPVFTATIMGKRCLFIADPELLTVVYKPSLSSQKNKKLDDISLQKQFMTNALGMTQDEVAAATSPMIFKEGLKQYHKHLFKGEWLEISIAKVQDMFRTVVIPALDDETATTTTGTTTEPKQQPLYRFVQSAVFKASVGPFFSPTLATDDAVKAFQDFDEGTTLLFQDGIPSFVTRVARAGRERLLKLLRTDEFWDTAAPLMVERKESKKITGTVLDKANVRLYCSYWVWIIWPTFFPCSF